MTLIETNTEIFGTIVGILVYVRLTNNDFLLL